MPWHRNDPDPLEERRRQLAEQERRLAEQMSRLTQQMHPSGEPPPPVAKPVEPPVWRLEEDHPSLRPTELVPTRKRHLARQSQRDMLLFFIAVGVLLVVMGIFAWVAYVHSTAPVTGP
jgi:hypothetical protein